MATMIPYGNLSKLVVVDLVLSPALIVLNTTAEQTFSCPGVKAGRDVVLNVEKPTAQAGLGIVGARISADDQVAITFSNNTGSSITPTASQRYRFAIGTIDAVQGNFS